MNDSNDEPTFPVDEFFCEARLRLQKIETVLGKLTIRGAAFKRIGEVHAALLRFDDWVSHEHLIQLGCFVDEGQAGCNSQSVRVEVVPSAPGSESPS